MISKLVIWKLSLCHLLHGVSVLFFYPVRTTGISAIMNITNNVFVTGMLFLTVSILAILGVYRKKTKAFMFMMLPQVAIMIYIGCNALHSIIVGRYANGHIPDIYPHLFIANDQLHAILVIVVYSASVIELTKTKFILYGK